MWNLKNKINEQTKYKQTYRYREQTDDCQRGGDVRDWVRKLKGLQSTIWQLQSSHGDVKYSTGNTVNNAVVTVYGARWELEYWGQPLVKHMIVQPLCCTPETSNVEHKL